MAEVDITALFVALVALVAVPVKFPVTFPVTFPVKAPANAVADKVPVLGTYDKLLLLYVSWLVPGDKDPINENCG